MSELIERQAVIDLLKQMRKDGDMVPWEGKKVFARIRMLPALQIEEHTEKRMETHACDLISRQAAIDALMERFKRVPTNAIIAKDIIERLPTVQPEPQWIPVSERLPETEEFVLASLTGKYRNITFEHACEIADYADGEWCVYAYPHMSAEKCAELIEAWMPLPEPYKPNK